MLARLGQVWNLSGLEERVKVVYSTRLSRQLGSCNAAAHSIRLNQMLKTQLTLEAETLCHEAAHVAVFEVFGDRCLPHGLEWKEFMRIAGFEPKVSLPQRGTSHLSVTSPSINVHEHRCTVCHSVRVSSRAISRWRCRACVAIGLEGRMLITKRTRKVSSE